MLLVRQEPNELLGKELAIVAQEVVAWVGLLELIKPLVDVVLGLRGPPHIRYASSSTMVRTEAPAVDLGGLRS